MTDVLPSSRIRLTDVGGVETRYYDDRGPGDPIVLIHGGHFGFFVPVTMESWSENLAPLADYGRVIAFDKLGQGETGLPLSDEQWTFDAVAQHACRFIESLDLTGVTVVGHSRGGLLAFRLAADLPDRIARLVVVSSATAAPADSGSYDMDFYDSVERTAPEGGGAAAIVRHYHAAQAVAEGELPAEYVSAAARMLESPRQRAAADGYRRNAAARWLPSLERAKRDLHSQLLTAGLTIPTLLIWGLDDRSAPIALGHALFGLMARKSSRCSMYVVNRAGHQVFRDQPGTFNGAVGAFAVSS